MAAAELRDLPELAAPVLDLLRLRSLL